MNAFLSNSNFLARQCENARLLQAIAIDFVNLRDTEWGTSSDEGQSDGATNEETAGDVATDDEVTARDEATDKGTAGDGATDDEVTARGEATDKGKYGSC